MKLKRLGRINYLLLIWLVLQIRPRSLVPALNLVLKLSGSSCRLQTFDHERVPWLSANPALQTLLGLHAPVTIVSRGQSGRSLDLRGSQAIAVNVFPEDLHLHNTPYSPIYASGDSAFMSWMLHNSQEALLHFVSTKGQYEVFDGQHSACCGGDPFQKYSGLYARCCVRVLDSSAVSWPLPPCMQNTLGPVATLAVLLAREGSLMQVVGWDQYLKSLGPGRVSAIRLLTAHDRRDRARVNSQGSERSGEILGVRGRVAHFIDHGLDVHQWARNVLNAWVAEGLHDSGIQVVGCIEGVLQNRRLMRKISIAWSSDHTSSSLKYRFGIRQHLK